MPLPKPHKSEEKKTFIARCMGDDVMNKDFNNNSQRAAVCYDIWDKNMTAKLAEELEN